MPVISSGSKSSKLPKTLQNFEGDRHVEIQIEARFWCKFPTLLYIRSSVRQHYCERRNLKLKKDEDETLHETTKYCQNSFTV
ncbi:17203_t:CDS:2 [Cetraspora pellucida]|uniref:17203_t:CDS:1 n=1 Tax=Cetraspora pellucida TaxID=1433469 RepID=A0A9N8ZUD8_9GLOM|nr:17203_t:CDS:2 [Cetraspora pellucida]